MAPCHGAPQPPIIKTPQVMLTSGKALTVEGAFDEVINKLWGAD